MIDLYHTHGPDDDAKFTSALLKLGEDAAELKTHDACTLDGVLFKASTARRKTRRTDNTGCMYVFARDNNVQETMYGRITNLFSHQLWAGAPIAVIAKVLWYTKKRTMYGGRLQVVHLFKREAWNLAASTDRYVPLAALYAQNVVFLPVSPTRECWDEQGELVAVFRHAEDRFDMTGAN